MKGMIQKLISNAVKTERALKGLSQEKMAERLHVSPNECGRYERGKHCPSTVPLMLFLYTLYKDGTLNSLMERFGALVRTWEDQ